LRFSEESGTAGLEEAMRYSLLAGGKRIRPVLALATAEDLGRDPAEMLPLAAALELIHTYSLIHDDLPAMDDDDLRRGRPTCHVKYGEDIAILAGDGLYAEAFRHLLQHQRAEPTRLLAAAAELATATGVNGMVGGQYIDVRGLVPGGDVGLRRLHELKTGRLIAASVECVLLLGAGEEAATRLPGFRAFAAELGVLFQIVDDILDVTGTEDALGKPQGSDERHGKLTYVSQYGVDGARRVAADSHRNALEALQRAGGAAELEHITDFIYTRSS
jgi:geranylgeranyl diphosphate synthase type II